MQLEAFLLANAVLAPRFLKVYIVVLSLLKYVIPKQHLIRIQLFHNRDFRHLLGLLFNYH
jgi:hypothetical protein